MNYKGLAFALTTLLLSGSALADTPSQDQCQEIAQMTPTDIFAKSQEGVTKAYDELAQDCFKQNACQSITDIDQPTCSRSLALNSYLIDVAYQTHGPAYPPYSVTLPQQNSPTVASKATTTEPAVYNNLATPTVTTDTTDAATNKPQETINWS